MTAIIWPTRTHNRVISGSVLSIQHVNSIRIYCYIIYIYTQEREICTLHVLNDNINHSELCVTDESKPRVACTKWCDLTFAHFPQFSVDAIKAEWDTSRAGIFERICGQNFSGSSSWPGECAKEFYIMQFRWAYSIVARVFPSWRCAQGIFANYINNSIADTSKP